LAPVGDLSEGIVDQGEGDAEASQLRGQGLMPIKVNLQAEGTPSGNSNKTQAQLLVDEIEVVMQTLAVIRPQEGLARLLVVPRLIADAGFQGRENADQAGVVPALAEDLLNAVFFAEVPFADELDLQAVLGCQPLRILSQSLPKGLSPAGIVENADVLSVQISRHALGVTEPGQGSLDPHAVVAGKHARDFLGMALGQQFHGFSSPSWEEEDMIENLPSLVQSFYLFGSGYAGLGSMKIERLSVESQEVIDN
jgi:hypothetical protein